MSRCLVLTLVLLVAVSVLAMPTGEQPTTELAKFQNLLSTVCASSNLEGKVAELCDFLTQNPIPEVHTGSTDPQAEIMAYLGWSLEFISLFDDVCRSPDQEDSVAGLCSSVPATGRFEGLEEPLSIVCAGTNLNKQVAKLCDFVTVNPIPKTPENVQPTEPLTEEDINKMLGFKTLLDAVCEMPDLEGNVKELCSRKSAAGSAMSSDFLNTACTRDNLEGDFAAFCEFREDNPLPAEANLENASSITNADMMKWLAYKVRVNALCANASKLEGDVATFCALSS